jgi:hypothetical protein
MSKSINTQLVEYQIASLEKRFDALERKFDDMFSLIMSLTISNNSKQQPTDEKHYVESPEICMKEIRNKDYSAISPNMLSSTRRRTLV